MGLFDFFRRKPRIRDVADLADFIDQRAAFLVQKGMYDYARARSGPHAKWLLGEAEFQERINQSRWRAHHAVFFIFIVSNCGGALTPIGDPPLLLGYLRGVPFLWTIEHLWPMWALVIGLLLAVFYGMDSNHVSLAHGHGDRHARVQWGKLEGTHNFLFLGIALAALFVTDPPFLREIILIGVAVASYWTTRREVHRLNEFLFQPITEVAILFAGIFVTMVPALDWLEANAKMLGIQTAAQFFWGSGALSSVLDNAPTYLTFLTTAAGAHGLSTQNPADVQQLIAQSPQLVAAIAVGCVFFGAMTYIGNAPNFMIKSIAEERGIKMPSFFGFMAYSVGLLVPIFGLVTWIWFR